MTPTTPQVPDAAALAAARAIEFLLNSECTTCRSEVMDNPCTGVSQVNHQRIHTRCGHSCLCSDFENCPGCGLLFRQCNHCMQRVCEICARAEAIHAAEGAAK